MLVVTKKQKYLENKHEGASCTESNKLKAQHKAETCLAIQREAEWH